MDDFTHLRVDEIRQTLGLTYAEFEREVGVSNNTIRSAILNKRSFRSDILNKILLKYPSFSATWLLTGIGNKLNSNAANEESIVSEATSSYNNYVTTELIKALQSNPDVKAEIIKIIKEELLNL